MLYQHKKTGARVKKVCSYEDGEYYMVEDQDGKIFTAFDHELILDKSATTKVKTLQIKDKAAKEANLDQPCTKFAVQHPKFGATPKPVESGPSVCQTCDLRP